MSDLKSKGEEYWKEKLTTEQYKVLRERKTEPPFTGALLENKEKGIYKCGACGQELFSYETKFKSGSGWPSFFDVLGEGKVELKEDNTLGMKRTEVVCSNCGSHLGHLFEDGPKTLPDGGKATGKRYCINSAALDFSKK